jgi:hypothetical protein
MPRNTRTNHRSVAKVPPEYARSTSFDGMPHGGVGAVPELAAWRYPLPKRRVGVIVCGQIRMRWCAVLRSSRAIAGGPLAVP